MIFPLKSFNPYWELINISNFIFVTADSVSMTSDALSSGKPTYVIPIKELNQKLRNFILILIRKISPVFIKINYKNGNMKNLKNQKK